MATANSSVARPPLNIAKELARLERLTVNELRHQYAEACGEPTRSRHREYLIKRIIWRIQANAEGDLSERALRRAQELANDADLRLSPPKVKTVPANALVTVVAVKSTGDHRLPPAGTLLVRQYKGQDLKVRVMASGFEYAGEIYKSLSAVAKKITGQHCNGYHFFRLGSKGGAA